MFVGQQAISNNPNPNQHNNLITPPIHPNPARPRAPQNILNQDHPVHLNLLAQVQPDVYLRLAGIVFECICWEVRDELFCLAAVLDCEIFLGVAGQPGFGVLGWGCYGEQGYAQGCALVWGWSCIGFGIGIAVLQLDPRSQVIPLRILQHNPRTRNNRRHKILKLDNPNPQKLINMVAIIIEHIESHLLELEFRFEFGWVIPWGIAGRGIDFGCLLALADLHYAG